MIIKYEKGVSFPVFIHVPDTLPWRLEVDVDNMEDDLVEYVLKLTCCGVEEVLLTSSGFHDLVDIGEEDEDEIILGLFCQILEAAAKETARVAHDKECVVDIAKVIQVETEFWIKFWECANQQRKEVDEV